MTVSEEAIEAAGEHLPPIWTSNPVYRAELRAALEAAMPFIAGPAYDEGARIAWKAAEAHYGGKP